jgi:hypothetical protein
VTLNTLKASRFEVFRLRNMGGFKGKASNEKRLYDFIMFSNALAL